MRARRAVVMFESGVTHTARKPTKETRTKNKSEMMRRKTKLFEKQTRPLAFNGMVFLIESQLLSW